MCIASIFFIDNTMITDFNIILNIIITTDQKFSRVLKIFIVLFGHYKFFVKMFFHHITGIVTFFHHTINEMQTASSPKYVLKGLLNLSSTHTNLYL